MGAGGGAGRFGGAWRTRWGGRLGLGLLGLLLLLGLLVVVVVALCQGQGQGQGQARARASTTSSTWMPSWPRWASACEPACLLVQSEKVGVREERLRLGLRLRLRLRVSCLFRVCD